MIESEKKLAWTKELNVNIYEDTSKKKEYSRIRLFLQKPNKF